jgi:hypothetical protein
MAKSKKGKPAKKGYGGTSGAPTTPGRAFASSSKGAAEFFAKNPDHESAVKSYTGYGYKRVNELLREGFDEFAKKHGKAGAKKVLAAAQQMQAAVNRAAEAGHVFKGDTVRGMSASPEQIGHWLKRGELVNKSLWSTSVSKGVAKNFTGNVVLHLKQHSGVALGVVSHFKHEKEVLIPAGKRFKITKSKAVGGVTHLWIRQVT